MSKCDCKASWITKKDSVTGKKTLVPVKMTDYVAALEDALRGLDAEALELIRCIYNVPEGKQL